MSFMNYIHFCFGQDTITSNVYSTYCTLFFTAIAVSVTMLCCLLWGTVTAWYMFYLYIWAAQLLHSFTISFKCGTVYSCFIFIWCLFSTLSMVEMLTVWMFSQMLLSSIMALFISLSHMALFSTTMVKIASSCSGVKRGPLPPLWSCLAVLYGKNIVMQNRKLR